jgi:hypothetical protein
MNKQELIDKAVEQLAKEGQAICREIEEKLTQVDESLSWYDYETQRCMKPAPIGSKVVVHCFGKGLLDAVVIGVHDRWNWLDIDGIGLETVDLCRIKPLDHATRKADIERKLFVDAVIAAIDTSHSYRKAASDLFDAGFRMPEDK